MNNYKISKDESALKISKRCLCDLFAKTQDLSISIVELIL